MEVKVFPARGHGPRLYEDKYFGSTFFRSSRPDEMGMYFVTQWFRIFGMPIKPKRRYYVKKLDSQSSTAGYRTNFAFGGSAELDQPEVIRTYLLSWVGAPLLVLLPMYLWIVWADGTDIHGLIAIGFPVVWLALSIAVIGKLIDVYFERYAPVHQAILPNQ